MAEFSEKLARYGACQPAVDWVASEHDGPILTHLPQAWNACVEPSWMYWLVQFGGLDVTDFRQTLMTLCQSYAPTTYQRLQYTTPASITHGACSFQDQGEMSAVLELADSSPAVKAELVICLRSAFTAESVAEGFERIP